MATSSITTASELLKLDYQDAIRYQLNYEADPLFGMLKRDTSKVQGSEVVLYMRFGRSGGVGWRSGLDDLPTANSRKGKQAKFPTKDLFARLTIQDKLIEASKNNIGAFARALQTEMEELMTDAKDEVSRAVYGDGTGTLGIVTDATSATAPEVDNIGYFAEGMLVDVYSGASLVKGGLEITKVDYDTSTITFKEAATGMAKDDRIVLAGSDGKAITGLGALFDTNITTIYGLSRTDYPFLNPHSVSVGGDLDLNHIQKGIDAVDVRAGSTTNALVAGHGVRRSYQTLLEESRRIVNTLNLKGGFTALSYTGGKGEIPFIATKYCPAKVLYGLDLNDWGVYQMADFHFMDRDGSVLHRVSNKPAWEASLVSYTEIACDKPRGQFVLTGITEN